MLQFQNETFNRSEYGFAYCFCFKDDIEKNHEFQWILHIKKEKEKYILYWKLFHYLIDLKSMDINLDDLNEPKIIQYMDEQLKKEKEILQSLIEKSFSPEDVLTIKNIEVKKSEFGTFINANIDLFTNKNATVSIYNWEDRSEWKYQGVYSPVQSTGREHFLLKENRDWYEGFVEFLLQHPRVRLYTVV